MFNHEFIHVAEIGNLMVAICAKRIFQLISLKFWVLKVKHFPARRRFRKSITEHLVPTIPTLGANSHLQGVKSQAADISQIFSPTHSWKFTALDIFANIALQIFSSDILPCKYFHLIYCPANIFTNYSRKFAARDIFANIPVSLQGFYFSPFSFFCIFLH